MKAATTKGEGWEELAANVGCDWEGDRCWADAVDAATTDATSPFEACPDIAPVDE